ncbi:MAG: hypothetical protein PVJ95_06115 [Cellvibrionales bacterium]
MRSKLKQGTAQDSSRASPGIGGASDWLSFPSVGGRWYNSGGTNNPVDLDGNEPVTQTVVAMTSLQGGTPRAFGGVGAWLAE